jgi:CHASE3 domain sensor protein
MRAKFAERMGVPFIIAVVTAVVLVYSYWGASLIEHTKQSSMFVHDTLSKH